MQLLSSNLRRHVIRRSAEGVRRLVEVDLEFAHAEVSDSDVALVIEQEIVQLEVSVRGNESRSSPTSQRLRLIYTCKRCLSGAKI